MWYYPSSQRPLPIVAVAGSSRSPTYVRHHPTLRNGLIIDRSCSPSHPRDETVSICRSMICWWRFALSLSRREANRGDTIVVVRASEETRSKEAERKNDDDEEDDLFSLPVYISIMWSSNCAITSPLLAPRVGIAAWMTREENSWCTRIVEVFARIPVFYLLDSIKSYMWSFEGTNNGRDYGSSSVNRLKSNSKILLRGKSWRFPACTTKRES